jgi:hypothetical protein
MVRAPKPILWACALAFTGCTSPNDTLPVLPVTADAGPPAADAPGGSAGGNDATGPPDGGPSARDAGAVDRPATSWPGRALGTSCSAGAECGSGSCVDGRCCEKSSCGVWSEMPNGMTEVSVPDYSTGFFTPGSRINNFDIGDTAAQMAGDRRAIVISGPTAGTCLVRTANGDPYPQGKAFRMAAGSMAWEEIPADYAFQTWVLVP